MDLRWNIHAGLKSMTAINETHTTITSSDGVTEALVLGVIADGGDQPATCGIREHLDGHLLIRARDVEVYDVFCN